MRVDSLVSARYKLRAYQEVSMNRIDHDRGPFPTLHAAAGALDCNILARPHLLALWAELNDPAELPALSEPAIGTADAVHIWAAETACRLDAFMAPRNADDRTAVRWYAHAHANEVRLTRCLMPAEPLVPHEAECIMRGDCRHTLWLQIIMLPMRLLVRWDTGTGVPDPVHFPLARRLGPHWPGIVSWSDASGSGTTSLVLRGAKGAFSESPRYGVPSTWELVGSASTLRWHGAAGGIVPLGNEAGDLAVTLPGAYAERINQIATENGWTIVPAPWKQGLHD
jgi:hypothetical protein